MDQYRCAALSDQTGEYHAGAFSEKPEDLYQSGLNLAPFHALSRPLAGALYGRMGEFLKPHFPLEKVYVSMEAEQAQDTSANKKVQ